MPLERWGAMKVSRPWGPRGPTLVPQNSKEAEQKGGIFKFTVRWDLMLEDDLFSRSKACQEEWFWDQPSLYVFMSKGWWISLYIQKVVQCKHKKGFHYWYSSHSFIWIIISLLRPFWLSFSPVRLLQVLGCLITQQHARSSIQLSCWADAHQVKGFPLVLNFCHPCQCAEELWHMSVLMSLLCDALNDRLKYLLQTESRPFPSTYDLIA